MADPDTSDSAAQSDEQDFALPGQDDGGGGGSPAPQGAPAGPQGSPAAQTSPQPPANAIQGGAAQEADTSADEEASAPKISGRAMFLGGLLKTILSGAVAGMGSSGTKFGNAVKAGSQAAPEQQLQQAKISTAMSDADQAKAQASITGMKALQSEYLYKRLPAEDQLRHLQMVSDFKQAMIKEGADVVGEGDDEKAADAQAFHLNGTDPRATGHAGKFYSLPTIDSDGKPKFDTVYVPSKDVLQQDYKYKDAAGNDQTIPAGTPMGGAMGKFVETFQKGLQDDTKAQHKTMGDALSPKVPDAQIPQTVDWLEAQQKQNTPLYQQNKNAVDAQINTLKAAHGQIAAEKAAVDARKAATKAAADAGKVGSYVMGSMPDGSQVGGTEEELKAAGATGLAKMDADTAKKMVVSRQLIAPNGLFNMANQEMRKLDSEGKLGVLASRWNAITTKAGDNPEFVPLMNHLKLLSTALMQAHVGSRGSEEMMEHFKSMADAGTMNAKTLRAALGSEYQYVHEKAMIAKKKETVQ
jgi:hypothetical protein